MEIIEHNSTTKTQVCKVLEEREKDRRKDRSRRVGLLLQFQLFAFFLIHHPIAQAVCSFDGYNYDFF